MKCDWCGSTKVKPTGGPKTWGNTEIVVCECGHELERRVPASLNTLDTAKPETYSEALVKFRTRFQLCRDYPYCQNWGCCDCKHEEKQ